MTTCQLPPQKEALALHFFLGSTWNYQTLKTFGVFMNKQEKPNVNATDNSADKGGQVTQDIGLSADKPETPNTNDASNPGDRIKPEAQTIEEKAQQVAVDAPDITGDHIKVPTYFVVDEPNGEQEALHHVKDAEEISDVIRQARTDEEGNRKWW
jgi:hypothetical protein